MVSQSLIRELSNPFFASSVIILTVQLTGLKDVPCSIQFKDTIGAELG